MMFGGSDHAWNLLRPLLETVAAAGPMGPCVDLGGRRIIKKFVKMVHNGIEYADMQMIAEIWDMVRHQVQPEDLPDLFAALNDSPLESFLIELTAGVLRRKDEISGAHLVNRVLDVAEQKGTGRWSVETALDLAVPIPSIAAAVSARTLSARKNERSTLAKIYPARGNISMIEPDVLIRAARATRLCVFAQGMQLIQAANQAFEWQISAAGVARVWTAGCIIRSSLLTDIVQAYTDRPELVNLIASPHFTATLTQCSPALRSLCASAMKDGIPVPVFSSTLTWFDSVRCDHLPQSLIQAQRDAFGAHTYRRTDDPDGPAIHTDWL
jgi:6-phosphogluconate dehydrogenase